MIEIKHTRPDGTEWSEWVPADSFEGRMYLSREFVSPGRYSLRDAEQNLDHEYQEAKAALKRLNFAGAAAHTRAMWAWAKVVAQIKKGR